MSKSQLKFKLGGAIAVLGCFFQSAAYAEPWGYPNELQEFVERQGLNIVTNAKDVVTYGLTSAGLPESPWSGDFWPDLKGSIADPYQETGGSFLLIPRLKRIMWKSNRTFLNGRTTLHQQLAGNSSSITSETLANLSPSEKYDMVMGDTNFTMTKKTVEMVDGRHKIGLTAPFSGVCHGWTAASLQVPRPLHPVTLQSPLGRPVTFYPDDIKALVSFLWGKGPAQNDVHFLGSKCTSGTIMTRAEDGGRLLDPKCFNVNPAFFHLVAINQLGLNHRGFIVDRARDNTVWNHPVYRYEMSFFNVNDPHGITGISYEKAKARVGDAWDAFQDFRSPHAKWILGVEMKFYYSKENMSPDHTLKDSPSRDNTDYQVMEYDLELDENDFIIGGEWRQLNMEYDRTSLLPGVQFTHPSSVWFPPKDWQAYSVADADISGVNWNGDGEVPKEWQKAAIEKASVATEYLKNPATGTYEAVPAPQALGPFVELLIKKSRE